MSTTGPKIAVAAALGHGAACHGMQKSVTDASVYTITFEISTDAAMLGSYTDRYLAHLWHIGQANPAAYGDAGAGAFAETIGREIIRRWLSSVPPELWVHQGKDYLHKRMQRTFGEQGGEVAP